MSFCSIFGARDLRAICRQMGEPVSYNGVSTYPDGQPVKGIFDRPVQMRLEDSGISGVATAKPEIRLPFDAFTAMPVRGDTVTVLGTDWTVSAPTADDDGAFLIYSLYRTS